ncbi:MAG: hypothetical protein U1E66_05615 [Rhodospirillales bacterium]
MKNRRWLWSWAGPARDGRATPWGVVVAVALLVAGCAASTEGVEPVAEAIPATVVSAAPTKVVHLQEITFALDPLASIGTMQGGIACLPSVPLVWADVRKGLIDERFTERQFAQVFEQELANARVRVVGGTHSPFKDQQPPAADVLVAGTITSLQSALCWPRAGFGDYGPVRGRVRIGVDWKAFSVAEKRENGVVHTDGSGETVTESTVRELLNAAFAQATRGLLADGSFAALIRADAGAPTAGIAPSRSAAPAQAGRAPGEETVNVR